MISIVFMWLIRYTLYTPSLSLYIYLSSLSTYVYLHLSIYHPAPLFIYIFLSLLILQNPSNLITVPLNCDSKKRLLRIQHRFCKFTNYVHTHHNKLDMCVPSPRLAPKTTFFQRDKNFYDLDIFINKAN